MRFLNKIVFINSASLKYAEIELNGNVHFIGTQGVGKSTLLRAILFFYNADKTKLGIPKEKKRFDEYYFEFQNSYIVYEVIRDGNPFCVLAFKQNGRVAFRFFNSAFHKAHFIDGQGRAFDSWEKTRDAFGAKTYYTKIISSYQEFRKIIYGDNKGLNPEYRKYALLESKQFQNIPRTIQNVLLNSKLEAKFIKDTIIKSLNEEEIKIDLRNYSKSHLRDFKTELNDIKIWSRKNKSGIILIRKQAEILIENYRGYNFLTKNKKESAVQLTQRLSYIKTQKPKLRILYEVECQKLKHVKTQVTKLSESHKNRTQKIISNIDLLKSKLKDASEKQAKYKNQNIGEIALRVSKKESLLSENSKLLAEKNLLTSDFSDIKLKYEALISQLDNQSNQFINEKKREINQCDSNFINKKIGLSTSYASQINHLKKENSSRLEEVKNIVDFTKDEFNKLERVKAELKHKEYFKQEIAACIKNKNRQNQILTNTENEITNHKKDIETHRKEKELEEKEINRQAEVKISKKNVDKAQCHREIEKIQTKIEQSKSSLYGWLNNNVKNWENSIGKVIDEEHVLFSDELNPRLISNDDSSFFGITINLNALQSKVKTVNEYQADIKVWQQQVEFFAKNIQKLRQNKQNDLDNLKKRFKKKNNLLKETISLAEHQKNQAERKLKEAQIELEAWLKKSKDEKEQQLSQINSKLDKAANDKLNAEENVSKIQKELQRQILQKEKERDKAISLKHRLNQERISSIEKEISENKKITQGRLKEIQHQQTIEFDKKGADTKRLSQIKKRCMSIQTELTYINDHEHLVIEYNKDKREIFDKVPEFKSEQRVLEQKQKSLIEEHRLQQQKLDQKYKHKERKVAELKYEIEVFENDLGEFERFKKSDAYNELDFLSNVNELASKGAETASSIIKKLTEVHHTAISRLDKLRHAIHSFIGNFKEDNIFSFKIRFSSDADYLTFAVDLKEFINEDKISEYQKRVNEKFAHIIQLIGKETDDLISKEAEIEKVIKKVNNDFVEKNFVGAIKSMEMRTQKSSNKIMRLLLAIKRFNDENSLSLGEVNLFSTSERTLKNEKAVELLKKLVDDLGEYKSETLTLSESFDLQFKIVENDNDSGWVEKLANVGSEGTDVLVKAMINILLLNVFKDSASKKFKDFKLHCMMDEVGRLHPNNVKGILRFANDRNILLINGSPTSYNATDYRYTYILSKTQSKTDKKKYITTMKRLIKAQTQS